jgi:hypothetical protein
MKPQQTTIAEVPLIYKSKVKASKIRCIHYGEYFFPDEESVALMSDGYLSAGDINTCDECWDMLNHQYDDLSDMISDADPGL